MLLSWLSSFIHARSQCVVLENCFSTWSYVTSGVPQGSVLGPILFLVFINDVASICCGETTVKLFADDLKLYSVYNSTDNSVDLQHSLDKLVEWSNLWQLQINMNKCQVLSIHNKSISNVSSNYSVNGFVLSSVALANDLGVYVDSNLSFKHHVVTKSRQGADVFFAGLFRDPMILFVKRSLLIFAPC